MQIEQIEVFELTLFWISYCVLLCRQLETEIKECKHLFHVYYNNWVSSDDS